MMNKHEVEIIYSRAERKYRVFVDREFVCYARNYSEGEIMANNYITELTTIEAMTINTLKGVEKLSAEEEARAWMTERYQHELTKKRASEVETPTYAVTYNDETDEYDVEINGEWIGSRPTYTQALDFGDEQLPLLTADNDPALPAPVQDFLTTLDDAPALPAIFTATAAKPLDAMILALGQAERLINRLGDQVISQTDEVTISVRGQPLTTVVVVVATRVAAKVAA
jgi:hypothetical protein